MKKKKTPKSASLKGKKMPAAKARKPAESKAPAQSYTKNRADSALEGLTSKKSEE